MLEMDLLIPFLWHMAASGTTACDTLRVDHQCQVIERIVVEEYLCDMRIDDFLDGIPMLVRDETLCF